MIWGDHDPVLKEIFLLSSWNNYFRVTSSEKVDKIQRYSDFYLCSVPYPGLSHWNFWQLSIIFVLPRLFFEYLAAFLFWCTVLLFFLLQVVNFLETLRTMNTMPKVYILIGNRWEIRRFLELLSHCCKMTSLIQVKHTAQLVAWYNGPTPLLP